MGQARVQMGQEVEEEHDGGVEEVAVMNTDPGFVKAYTDGKPGRVILHSYF